MKTAEQKLFELIDIKGEVLTGDLHILETREDFPLDEERAYRVYHKSGLCFDIKKEAEIDEDSGEVEKYNYTFYDEWDGFKKMPISDIIKLINKNK